MIEQSFETSEPTGGSGWFLNHLPTILWQRRYWIIGATLLLSIAGIVAAYMLPTVYRSAATLLVQSQDLPTTVVDAPSNGVIEQRIAKIRERVLSRGDLVSLIEQNDLYAKERRKQPLSKIIDDMRKATTVGALAGDIGASGNNTIAVNMSFDYPDPVKAQAVLQSYVNSFLRMDNEAVEQQAGITVRFLQDQAVKLQSEISTIENQITELKARNGAALTSGGGGSSMIDTGAYTAQIAGLESQNRQLASSTGRRASRDPDLAAAEAALATARAKYADTHPDVVQAQQRLDQIRAITRADSGGQDDSSLARAQIDANNRAIANLSEARQSALSRAAAASAGSARAPAILEQAMQLEGRAAALRSQYNEVGGNLLKAQNNERMANEQRAERLSLVDAPDLPDHPHSPNRPLLIAGGVIGGLMLGLFLALAIELLNAPMRSPSQIEGMGLPVLGVVPVLNVAAPARRRFAWPFKRKEALA